MDKTSFIDKTFVDNFDKKSEIEVSKETKEYTKEVDNIEYKESKQSIKSTEAKSYEDERKDKDKDKDNRKPKIISKKAIPNESNELAVLKLLKKHNREHEDKEMIDISLHKHFFLKVLEKSAR